MTKRTLTLAVFLLFVGINGTANAQLFVPQVVSITPEFGPPGSWVAINGGQLHTVTQVLMNGVPLQIASIEPTRITVQIPPGARDGQFVVLGPSGQAISPRPFRVMPGQVPVAPQQPGYPGGYGAPAPVAAAPRVDIAGFLPQAGTPGQTVEIFGAGFAPVASGNTVLIGGITVPVLTGAPNKLQVRIPNNATSGNFQVEANGAVAMSPGMFTVVAPISVSSFFPVKGSPGASIRVKGKGFDPGTTKAYVGAIPALFTVLHAGEGTLTVPQGARSGKVLIAKQGAGHSVSDARLEILEPVLITGFNPLAGYGGATVTITGAGFDPNSKKNSVTLAGKKCEVVAATQTSLSIVLPTGASSGQFEVMSPGRGKGVSSGQFLVGANAAISNVSPSQGMPGTKVRITGVGLDNPGITVTVGGKDAKIVSGSSRELNVEIPEGATTGPIVLNAPGSPSSSSPKDFVVVEALTITGFSPQEGSIGSIVYLDGSGFDLDAGKTKVFVGVQKAKTTIESTSRRLAIEIPSGSKGGLIKVQVFGRGEASTNAPFVIAKEEETQVMVIDEDPYADGDQGGDELEDILGLPGGGGGDEPSESGGMKIVSLDPTTAAPGDMITVEGAGFGNDPDIIKAWIGGVSAMVGGAMDDMLIIEVPAGAKSGPMKVKVGGKTLTSKQRITIQ